MAAGASHPGGSSYTRELKLNVRVLRTSRGDGSLPLLRAEWRVSATRVVPRSLSSPLGGGGLFISGTGCSFRRAALPSVPIPPEVHKKEAIVMTRIPDTHSSRRQETQETGRYYPARATRSPRDAGEAASPVP